MRRRSGFMRSPDAGRGEFIRQPDYGFASLAAWVTSWPRSDVSLPAPATVLQAVASRQIASRPAAVALLRIFLRVIRLPSNCAPARGLADTSSNARLHEKIR